MTRAQLRGLGMDDGALIREFRRLNPGRFEGEIKIDGDDPESVVRRAELFELVTTRWIRDPGLPKP